MGLYDENLDESDLEDLNNATSDATEGLTLPLPPTVVEAKAGSAPSPIPTSNKDVDVLRSYLTQQAKDYREAQDRAEETAGKNRFYARLGGAFNTIGQGLAGQKVDNAPFEQLATDAQSPLARLERSRKIDEDNNKLISSYIMQKYKLGEKDKDRAIREKGLAQSADFQQKRLDAMNTNAAENRKLREAVLGMTDKQRTETLTQSLRKEATSGEVGKIYANYTQAERAGKAVSEFLKDPNGYTDYGTLMLALKSLQGDQSVVREAEMKQGKSATSFFNKAENAIQQAMEGKSLQPEQRNDIAKAIGILGGVAKDQYVNATRHIYTQAKRKNLPLEEIFSDPSIYTAPTPGASNPKGTTPAAATAPNAPPPGRVWVIHPKTGRVGSIPEKDLQKAINQGYQKVGVTDER